MPTVNETTDADFTSAPIYSISLDDTFAGLLDAGIPDEGDNLSVGLVAGQTYTLVLDGLSENDVFDLTFSSLGVVGQFGIETYDGGLVGGAGPDTIWADGDAGSGTLRYTFVASETASYELEILRTGQTDGNVSYTLDVYHGAIDNVSEGNDTIRGTTAPDSYIADTGDDSIVSGLGDDTVYGQAGEDTIRGNGGNDAISGGADNDTVDGQKGNDVVYGDGGDDRVGGGNGHDTMLGGDGNDRMFGNRGNDLILGEGDNDLIKAGEGEDTIYGGEGDDTMQGGFGSDVYVMEGNNGNDVIEDFQIGFDRIDVSALGYDEFSDITLTQVGSDAVITVDGSNSITLENTTAANITDAEFIYLTYADTGTINEDTMNGTSGDDWYDALAGDDIIYGNDGNDWLLGNDGRDSISGGNNNDLIEGGRDNDVLLGNNGFDTIFGGSGNDVIDGGGSDDSLIGESGKDTINGGTGDDTIIGGNSNDNLTGGAGFDVFVFESTAGDDFLNDFEDGIDMLDVSALVDDGHITGFSDFTLTQFGGNLVVNLYGGYDLTMNGVTAAEITAADFIF